MIEPNAVVVLTEVREHAVREASMYDVSADQYAATNNESRMDEESAVASAYRDIVNLIDRMTGNAEPSSNAVAEGGAAEVLRLSGSNGR